MDHVNKQIQGATPSLDSDSPALSWKDLMGPLPAWAPPPHAVLEGTRVGLHSPYRQQRRPEDGPAMLLTNWWAAATPTVPTTDGGTDGDAQA